MILDPIVGVCTLIDRSRTYAAVSECGKELSKIFHLNLLVIILILQETCFKYYYKMSNMVALIFQLFYNINS